MSAPSRSRPAWVEVDASAIAHNARVLAGLAAPAALCAVVKADGYGHGAVTAARAALAGGARWLAVATVDEGVALREAGVDAPVLLLSEPAGPAMEEARARGLTPTVDTPRGVEAAARAADRVDGGPWTVHLKVDTGMHRVGADPPAVPGLAAAVLGSPALRLGALWTHLAVADEAGPEARAFTDEQLARFDGVVDDLRLRGVTVPMRHAANSAGVLAHPRARLELVRCGIALYGVAPSDDLQGSAVAAGLRPALSWRAQVTRVRRLPAGARPSYGRARPLPAGSAVAVVPVGYADGVPRRYFAAGGTVLIGGRPRPLAGMVTMDQLVVDCGPGDDVAVGDEVVLVGSQGAAVLSAPDWARTLGTIAYEVLCAIGPRVPRVVVDGDATEPPAAGVGTGREGG